MPSLPIRATLSPVPGAVSPRRTRRPARRRGAARLGVPRLGALALAGGLLGALPGCGGLTDPKLPAGVPDPASYRTPAGALALYRAAVTRFQMMFPDFIGAAGLLTDELQIRDYGGSPFVASGGSGEYFLDVRIVDADHGNAIGMYGLVNVARRNAGQALGALAKYDSAHHPALMGELYALEGYAELLLADLYCSGIPLSTVEFEGDYVLRAGSSTQQVYQHAVALFDSALALSADSARILNLARVGKGRAYLNLGQYDAAAAAVAAVPDAFRYEFPVVWAPALGSAAIARVVPQVTSVSDREGVNGLPYRSSGDPRSQVVQTGTNNNGFPVYFPAKYGEPGSTTPVVLASGVEARLVEAEAALHGVASSRGSWLDILNALRTDGTTTTVTASTILDTLGVTGCPNPDGSACGAALGDGSAPANGQPDGYAPAQPGSGYTVVATTVTDGADALLFTPAGGSETSVQSYCNAHSWYNPCWQGNQMVVLTYVRPASTTWNAGSGGVAHLAPLEDPGSADARVDRVFEERAYWLFATGTRQGDLRRLVRSVSRGGYGRNQAQVYPSGVYFGPGGTYGGDVNVPVPATEQQSNPKYQGCFNRGA